MLLQADDDTPPPSHRVYNIICQAAGVKPEKSRDAMEKWVEKHLDWVKSVTSSYLDKIGLSFKKFHEQWLHPSFPLNPAGILIMSRAYKLHTALFFNDKYWTTIADVSGLHKCTVFLVYRGGTIFQDTRRMTVAEYQERKPLFKKLDSYYDRLQSNNSLDKLRSRAYNTRLRNCIPSDNEDTEMQHATPEQRTDLLSNIMPTADEQDADEDVPATPVKSNEELDLEEILNDTVETDNAMQKHSEQENKEAVETEEHETEQKEVIANKTERHATENIMQNKVDKNKTESEEKEVKTKATAADAKANIMLQPVVRLRDIASSPAKSTISKTATETSTEADGTSSSETESEPEPPKKQRQLSVIGELIKNITPDRHGRFQCPKCGCNRNYGTKRAVHRHIQNNHSSKKRFHCVKRNADGTDCLKDFGSQQILNQHVQGEHGPGFEAYCGEVFKWPHERCFHQQEDCEECAKYL